MALLRSWAIRGIILCLIAVLGVGGWIVTHRVSPEQVRAALIHELESKLNNVEVHVGSARLRLFGGVTVTDLRLSRPGDSAPFFAAPTAIIYHDKQTLHRGQMSIRKIEFDDPIIRLDRRADGSWNVANLTKPTPDAGPVPTVVVRNATVFVSDHLADGLPPILVSDVRLTIVNDPIAMLTADVQAVISPVPEAGAKPAFTVPLSLGLRYNRDTRQANARVEVADLAFTPDLAPALAKVNPVLAEYAAEFTGRFGVKADLVTQPGEPLRYDVRVDLRSGHFENENLPHPLEQIAASVRICNGRVTVERGTAQFGKATVDLTLETRAANAGAKEPVSDKEPVISESCRAIQDRLERLELTVRNVALDDDLFGRLPPSAVEVRRLFGFQGALDTTLKFTRNGATWRRELEFRPNRLGLVYAKFPYPVNDLAGRVVQVIDNKGTDEFQIHMTGTAGGRRIEATGTVSGDGPDPQIRLRIAGNDVPIDDTLFDALPPKTSLALRKLRASGRGDFVADIRQDLAVNRCENAFRIRVYGGGVNYTHFPYPLTDVKGDVLIRASATDTTRPLRPGMPITAEEDTDVIELRGFEARHGDGKLWLSGDNDPVPGTKDRKLKLRMQGLNCPVNNDLKTALAALRLTETWNAFQPRGRLTFGVDLEVLDRYTPDRDIVRVPPTKTVSPVVATLPAEPPFDPVADLKLTMNFRGPTIVPQFFPYTMDDLAGVLRYQGGKLDLAKVSARHGESQWALDAGEVRFAARGEVWANLGRFSVTPFKPDATFLAGLPAKIRGAIQELNPRGGMDLLLTHVVIHQPPDPVPQTAPPAPTVARGQAPPTVSPDPIIYWDGELRLVGAAIDAGVPWEELHGVVASTGRYDGTCLGAVVGNAWLDKATVARQPVTGAKFQYRVRPQQPDPERPGQFAAPVLELPDISAAMYQGSVGGEARVVLASPVRYRLWLTAANVKLEELAARLGTETGVEVSGLAQGKLVIENQADPQTGLLTLTGSGQIDVPSGRMYNLPVLMPLLKLLKLQAPDQTAFEEAHATFALRGDRVSVSQLDLIGTAVSLGGSGELDTRGEDVRFEFYTVWSQAIKRWLTTPRGFDLTAALSENLFKIEVRKVNGEMEYKPHMLPGVTEPVKAAADRVRTRMGRQSNVAAPPPTVRATIQR